MPEPFSRGIIWWDLHHVLWDSVYFRLKFLIDETMKTVSLIQFLVSRGSIEPPNEKTGCFRSKNSTEDSIEL